VVTPRALHERAMRVRLVLTDNDGVLTDGGVYYSSRGEVMKRFDVRDGMGVELLRQAGIETGIVSRERSRSLAKRAEKLRIRLLFLGVEDKAKRLPDILAAAGVSPSEIAYIGDDVNDLGIIEAVGLEGLTGAPANAVPSVAQAVHHRGATDGGHGAFREFADWLLAERAKPGGGRRES